MVDLRNLSDDDAFDRFMIEADFIMPSNKTIQEQDIFSYELEFEDRQRVSESNDEHYWYTIRDGHGSELLLLEGVHLANRLATIATHNDIKLPDGMIVF